LTPKEGCYEVPEGVELIFANAFSGCKNLERVVLSDSVAQFNMCAISWCPKLEEVYVGRRVEYINRRNVRSCAELRAINVDTNNPFLSSKDGVLFDKKQTSLLRCPPARAGCYVVPDGVVNICELAFEDCRNLTCVVVPESVVHVCIYAFVRCPKLEKVYFKGNAPSFCRISDNVFAGSSLFTVYYSPGATGWGPTYARRPAMPGLPKDADK
jgi:hypothetical protein